MNVVGVYMPRLIIFLKKNIKFEFLIRASLGAVVQCDISDYVRTDIFTRLFKHFLKLKKSRASVPVPLVLDWHYLHTKNVELKVLAKKSHLINKMKPLGSFYVTPKDV